MIFNQIYRILSFIVSAVFLVVFGFAMYDMVKRAEYRKVNLFEVLLAGAFFTTAVLITLFSMVSFKYGKQKERSSELIDLGGIAPPTIVKKNSIPFYILGILNLMLSIVIILFFSYGFVLNFLNGRQFDHFSILPLIILSSFIIFGMLQLIYSIRMIRFHRKLKG